MSYLGNPLKKIGICDPSRRDVADVRFLSVCNNLSECFLVREFLRGGQSDVCVPPLLASLARLRKFPVAAGSIACRVSHNSGLSGDSIQRVVQPTVTEDGEKAPALKFGQPRVMALFLASTLFQHLIDGFHNRDLRVLVAALLGVTIADYTGAQMTYDLRRLRLKGLIFPATPHPPLFRHTLRLEGRAVVLAPGGEGLPTRSRDVYRQRRRLALPAPRLSGSHGCATR